jgi:DNA-binding transcriptional regulator GbsR (MarR family)
VSQLRIQSEEVGVSVTLPRAMHLLIEFLGELGPRWGLAEACRVHGYLYLRGRPATDDELRVALNLDSATLKDAIAWLKDYRLIELVSGGAWQTGNDPWDLMMRALDERRRREVGPALATLREGRRLAFEERGTDPILRKQIDQKRFAVTQEPVARRLALCPVPGVMQPHRPDRPTHTNPCAEPDQRAF